MPPARFEDSLIARPLIGKLAEYASGTAEIGVTVACGLPRPSAINATAEPTITTAAAIAKGSQLRGSGSVGRAAEGTS